MLSNLRCVKKIVTKGICLVLLITTLLYCVDKSSHRRVFQTENHIHAKHLSLNPLEEPQGWDLAPALEEEQMNLPFQYWLNYAVPLSKTLIVETETNSSCAHFPHLLINVRLHNTYWQTFQQGNIIFRLYGAYYDNREKILGRPYLHLLVLSNQPIGPFPLNYCQLWFVHTKSIRRKTVWVSGITQLWHWQWTEHNVGYYPYILECEMVDSSVPKSVSLVPDHCTNATNSLRVIFEPAASTLERRKAVAAICLSNFYNTYNESVFSDWLELQHSLGIHKIYIYNLKNNGNFKNISQHNKHKDIVEERNFTFGTIMPTTPLFQSCMLKRSPHLRIVHKAIIFTDCFYRHMYKYRHLAMLDNYAGRNATAIECFHNTKSLIGINDLCSFKNT